ncbi:MAG TPA: hypothetical protein VH478_01570, partial [Trebonia sp.]|nr:hypothetical protein [Trebonia sp.]
MNDGWGGAGQAGAGGDAAENDGAGAGWAGAGDDVPGGEMSRVAFSLGSGSRGCPAAGIAPGAGDDGCSRGAGRDGAEGVD